VTNSFVIAILAGLGAMLGWGISDFFGKKAVDKVSDVVFLFWLQLVGFIAIFVYVVFFGQWALAPVEKTPQIFVMAGVNLLASYLFYRALKKGKVSVISPINASYAIFTIPISIFFFQEHVSRSVLFLLAIVTLGVLLTSLDIKGIAKDGFDRKDLSKGVPDVLLNVLLLSIWIPFWDQFLSSNNWLMSLFLFKVMIMAILVIFVLVKKINLKINDKKIFKWIIISGLLYSVGYISFDWGFGTTPHTSLITALSATFPAPTLLLSRIFLKEKLQLTQWAGVGLILGSLVVLGFI
jgi:uncharacterized membrane protein